MSAGGALKELRRERHPLVALAVVAFILPYLFLAGGLHVHADAFHLGDGTVVICTGEGFERVASDDAPVLGEDGAACCGVFCPHAAPAAITGGGSPVFEGNLVQTEFPAAVSGPVVHERRLDPIRAPPANLG